MRRSLFRCQIIVLLLGAAFGAALPALADVHVALDAKDGTGVTGSVIIKGNTAPFNGTTASANRLPAGNQGNGIGFSVVMLFSDAGCEFSSRAAMLYNQQLGVPGGVVLQQSASLTGMLVVTTNVPEGNPPPGGPFVGGLNSLKSVGILQLTKTVEEDRGIQEDGVRLLACGDINREASPEPSAHTSENGYLVGTWAMALGASLLAIAGGALVLAAVQSKL